MYSSEEHDHTETYFVLVFLVVLIIFVIVGAYMEQKKFIVGHETGVIILLGMLISFIFHSVDPTYKIQFNPTVFFDLALPLILVAAGFNMRRKQFFKNFANITKFGIFGSLITYAVYVTLFWLLFQYGNLSFTDPMELDKGK